MKENLFFGIEKYATLIIFSVLIVFSIVLFNIYKLESQKRNLKSDLIELSYIKYGMFNVDKWKEKISVILTKKIKEIKISDENKFETKEKINKFLDKVINDFESNYRESNRENSLFGISLKNMGASIFSIFKKLKKEIPVISEGIVNYLEKETNREKIKEYILSQMNKYSSDTFQKIDYTKYNNILKKYSSKNEVECNLKLIEDIKYINKDLKMHNLIIIILTLLLFFIIMFYDVFSKFQIILLILIALSFLFLGIKLPMIDIDARIGLMEFNLIGENISFQNQVLYYKSKSVLEMAKIMLFQGEIKVIFVGLLVLVFSVFFPVLKLISTILYLFREKFIRNKIINFMVFKSGKWSMADVMVVAIFMSYIGFTGIISNQLAHLENITDRLSIIATNNSELETGFFFFIAFVFLSMSISQILSNQKSKIR